MPKNWDWGGLRKNFNGDEGVYNEGPYHPPPLYSFFRKDNFEGIFFEENQIFNIQKVLLKYFSKKYKGDQM